MKKLILTIIGFLILIPMEAQLLQSYLSEAAENNPEIRAFNLRYDIAVEKSNEQSNLNNTEFSAGYFVSEPETRTGAQKLKLSVNQMIPWFGTNSAREDYAASMAESQLIDVLIAKKKLKFDVSQSYYRLFSINAKKRVATDNINLLKNYERLALTAVEVGRANAYDVLRLQIRQNEIEQKKQIYENDFLAEQIIFNKLLNRNDDVDIILPESIAFPMKESLVIDFDSLHLHPELARYDRIH
jgi:cobalt-zinc-cadmium efflux system outer membrane protein